MFMNKEIWQLRQKAFSLKGHGGDEWGEVKLKSCEGWWEGGKEGNGGMGLISKYREDSKVESEWREEGEEKNKQEMQMKFHEETQWAKAFACNRITLFIVHWFHFSNLKMDVEHMGTLSNEVSSNDILYHMLHFGRKYACLVQSWF